MYIGEWMGTGEQNGIEKCNGALGKIMYIGEWNGYWRTEWGSGKCNGALGEIMYIGEWNGYWEMKWVLTH